MNVYVTCHVFISQLRLAHNFIHGDNFDNPVLLQPRKISAHAKEQNLLTQRKSEGIGYLEFDGHHTLLF